MVVVICGCAFVPAALAQVPAGPEFQINVTTAGQQRGAQPAILQDGGFVVVWSRDLSVVVGRRFDAAGLPSTAEFRVDESTSPQPSVSVSADSGNAFIIAWAKFGPEVP